MSFTQFLLKIRNLDLHLINCCPMNKTLLQINDKYWNEFADDIVLSKIKFMELSVNHARISKSALTPIMEGHANVFNSTAKLIQVQLRILVYA